MLGDADMAISEVTVKVHRHNVMRKLAAKSLADLVRMADALGLSHKIKVNGRRHLDANGRSMRVQ